MTDQFSCLCHSKLLRDKNVGNLNIKYRDIQIKQHSKVEYLECMLDEAMSGEAITLSVLNKINNKLKFLNRKNRFLIHTLS